MLSVMNWSFFFYLGYLSRTLTTHRTARDPSIFYSTLALPPAHEHSEICLQLCMWDDYRISFNRTACIYQTATRLDLPPLSNNHLTYWWCEVSFCLFTWWFDTRFLLQQPWYRKPVDSNSHRLSPLYYKRTD